MLDPVWTCVPLCSNTWAYVSFLMLQKYRFDTNRPTTGRQDSQHKKRFYKNLSKAFVHFNYFFHSISLFYQVNRVAASLPFLSKNFTCYWSKFTFVHFIIWGKIIMTRSRRIWDIEIMSFWLITNSCVIFQVVIIIF